MYYDRALKNKTSTLSYGTAFFKKVPLPQCLSALPKLIRPFSGVATHLSP